MNIIVKTTQADVRALVTFILLHTMIDGVAKIGKANITERVYSDFLKFKDGDIGMERDQFNALLCHLYQQVYEGTGEGKIFEDVVQYAQKITNDFAKMMSMDIKARN